MNRRSFLTTLAGASAALAFDPERLLWTPKKTIFIPKPSIVESLPRFIGICAGMLIPADAIDEAGPVFVRDGNWYRHVTLKEHVYGHNGIIYAVPDGKLEVCIKGITSLGVSYSAYEHQLS